MLPARQLARAAANVAAFLLADLLGEVVVAKDIGNLAAILNDGTIANAVATTANIDIALAAALIGGIAVASNDSLLGLSLNDTIATKFLCGNRSDIEAENGSSCQENNSLLHGFCLSANGFGVGDVLLFSRHLIV